MKRSIAVVASFLIAAACGDDKTAKTGPLRVEIVTVSADGAPPRGLALRSEDGKTTLPLVPAKDGGAADVEADGPAGRYFVIGPEGWAVVGTNEALAFEPGLAATPVPIGRRYCLYLVPPEHETIGEVEVVRPIGGGRPPEAVAPKRASGDDRRVVLRVGPAEWHGSLRVTARVGDVGISPSLNVKLPEDGAPTGIQIAPGPVASLDVRLFRPEDGRPASAVPVSVTGSLGTLAVRAVATTDADGVARFAALPSVVPSLSIGEVRDEVASSRTRFTAAEWRVAGEVRLLRKHTVLEEVPFGHVRPPPIAYLQFESSNLAPEGRVVVQARRDGGPSYSVGAESAAAPGSKAALRVLLPPGRYRFLVTGTGNPAVAALSEATVAEGATSLLLNFEPTCRIGASVAPSGAQHPVRVLCRRKEGEDWVLAQGWSVRADAPGTAEISLPTGVYRLTVFDGAREGPPVPLTLEKPGSQAQVNLLPP